MALERLFGGAVRSPVMVPPWNRIAPVLVPTLAGDRLSRACRPSVRANAPSRCAGCVQVNTHVDLIDWKARPRLRRRGGRCSPRW
jgi:hypothetical protein